MRGRWTKILIIVMSVFAIGFTSGCSVIRKEIVKMGQWDIKNAEASRQVAKDILSTWLLNSGFIRASLGEGMGKLPNQAVKAMDELDLLAAKTEWSDFELGSSLGLRVRMLGSLIVSTLQQYFPGVLKDVPDLLMLLL